MFGFRCTEKQIAAMSSYIGNGYSLIFITACSTTTNRQRMFVTGYVNK